MRCKLIDRPRQEPIQHELEHHNHKHLLFVLNRVRMEREDFVAQTLVVANDGDLIYASTIEPWYEKIVCAPGCQLTDSGCARLPCFRNLKQVSLRGKDVTDAGAQYLEGLTGLEVLDVTDTSISGQALKYIGKLVKLTALYGGLTRIDDAGLVMLKALVELQCLHLYGTSVRDNGLTHLRPFGKLTELRLDHLPLTNQGLQHLAALPELLILGLRGSGINDPAMAVLAQLKKLCDLDVSDNPKVQIAGLKQFGKSQTLSRLVTTGTSITSGERINFEKALGRPLLA